MEDYKKALELDILNLDEACLNQAYLFDKYTEELPALYKEKNILKLKEKDLKFNIEIFCARADAAIREKYGLEGIKFTESKILNEIKQKHTYIELNEKLLAVQGQLLDIEVKIQEIERKKDALMLRRDMLKLLTEQYIAGYYSVPEPKSIKRRRIDNIEQKLEEKIKEDRKGGKK